MKLDNLVRQVSAPYEYPRGLITFAPDLWQALEEYRNRREQSGLVRLGARVMLGLVTGGAPLESAADHLVISCATDEDVQELLDRCAALHDAVEDRLARVTSE